MSQCKFFVKRKKRFCRLTVKEGDEYCGEHRTSDVNTSETTRKRIPCPLDNSHSCDADNLSKHLQVCNAKEDILPAYIVKNINTGDWNGTENYALETSERHLSKVPIDRLKTILEKIKKAYYDYCENRIDERILESKVLNDELLNPIYGAKTRKHLIQTSSLLGNLEVSGLLEPYSTFIEFGAGKGQLSYWIYKATEKLPQTSVILVDKASHRHKMDNKLRLTGENEEQIHRIRANIADLDLSQVEVVKTSPSVIGVTKHLCGVATDYALRCLVNLHTKKRNVDGLMVSFCCHHRCLWKDYVGKEFLLSRNLTPYDFDVICGIASWATSGVGMSREKREELEQAKSNDSIMSEEVKRNLDLGLSRDEKTEYGKMAKMLLDYGRMNYLESNHFKCNMYFYVKQEISLENVCLAAVAQREREYKDR